MISSKYRANPDQLLLQFLLYATIVVGGIIFAIPFYWMIRTAVMPPWQINQFPPQWIPAGLWWENLSNVYSCLGAASCEVEAEPLLHFENFRKPFDGPFPFSRWFLNSGLVAILSALGVVLSSSIVGFAFARLRFPYRNTLFIIVLSTMMLPEHVRLIPTYLLFVWLGWVNTFAPLILPNWFAPAFHVFLMRQFFMTLPQELDDAAEIDGCGYFGIYSRIHLPLSLPVMGVSAIYQITFSWNDFLHPLIYLQEVKLYTVAVGLRLFEGYMSSNMQDMMAAALMAVLPTIVIFFVAQRYFIQGIVITGVKG
ncbi:MAG: carbohydrate ABC transporter permease [Chloroflexota bacterium]